MTWLDPFFNTRIQFPLGTTLPQRTQLAFTGSGVSVADDAVNSRTTVTISSGAPLVTTSRSVLSATPDLVFTDGAPAYNTESGYRARWRLDRRSTLSVDGITVLATQSGSGNWVLESRYTGRVPLTECGAVGDGITNDGPVIQAALAALSGSSVTAVLPAASYLIGSTVTVPSNVRLFVDEGATLVGGLTISGTKTNAVLSAVATLSSTTTTLASTPTFGSRTLSLTSATGFAKGQLIAVRSGTYTNLTYYYTAENLSGTTVTTDHPLLMPWASGDTVTVVSSAPTNIVIEGKGQISGSADTFVYIQGGQFCEVSGVFMTPTAALSFGVYFDLGGYRNRVRGVRLEANGNGSTSTYQASGLILEANHASVVEQCASKNFSPGASESFGILFVDCAECELLAPEVAGCDIGICFIAFNDSAPACYACRCFGGSTINNVSAGFDIAFSSSRCTITGTEISFNGGNGVLNEAGCLGNALIGCAIRGNANGINQNGDRLSIVGCEISGNSGWGIITSGGSIDVIGCSAPVANTSGFAIIETGAVTTYITGGDFVLGSGYGVYVQNCPARVKNATFSGGGTVFNLATSGAVLALESVVLRGSSTVGVATIAGTTAKLGFDVDLTAATTPISNSSGTVTQVQGQGVYTDTTTTGTVNLTHVQAASAAMDFNQSLTGNLLYQVPAGIKGLVYVVDTTGATYNSHTLSIGVVGGAAVSVPASGRHIVYSEGANIINIL